MASIFYLNTWYFYNMLDILLFSQYFSCILDLVHDIIVPDMLVNHFISFNRMVKSQKAVILCHWNRILNRVLFILDDPDRFWDEEIQSWICQRRLKVICWKNIHTIWHKMCLWNTNASGSNKVQNSYLYTNRFQSRGPKLSWLWYNLRRLH